MGIGMDRRRSKDGKGVSDNGKVGAQGERDDVGCQGKWGKEGWAGGKE